MANNVKTVLLLGLLTGIILFIGSFWGQNGLTIALFMSVLMNFGSYFFSDKIALSMSGAKPVSREEAPRLYGMLESQWRRHPARHTCISCNHSPAALS
jgi:heat shock protein HtpX